MTSVCPLRLVLVDTVVAPDDDVLATLRYHLESALELADSSGLEFVGIDICQALDRLKHKN